jgi:hypothetical protein
MVGTCIRFASFRCGDGSSPRRPSRNEPYPCRHLLTLDAYNSIFELGGYGGSRNRWRPASNGRNLGIRAARTRRFDLCGASRRVGNSTSALERPRRRWCTSVLRCESTPPCCLLRRTRSGPMGSTASRRFGHLRAHDRLTLSFRARYVSISSRHRCAWSASPPSRVPFGILTSFEPAVDALMSGRGRRCVADGHFASHCGCRMRRT